CVDVYDCLRESLWGFLWKVVADTSGDCAVYVLANKLPGVGFWGWVRGAVGVAFQCDGGYFDLRSGGEALFEFVVSGFDCGESLPPAVIVDHDVNMVGVVERGGASVESGVIKLPLG